MTQLTETQVFDILRSIDRSADFYACQNSKAFFPQLQIEGLGADQRAKIAAYQKAKGLLERLDKPT